MPYASDGDNPVMGYTAEKAADKTRGVYHAEGIYAHAGYFMMKVNINAEDIKNGSVNDRNTRIFRYPEVILMFAECAAETGNQKDVALELVQAIQNRAESKTVWASTADVTLENVKKEKMMEMWLEGCRFQDLVRWGIAYDKMKNQGSVCPFLDSNGNVDYRPFNGEDPSKYGFKQEKHNLLPYPGVEIRLNPNIVQNPGW